MDAADPNHREASPFDTDSESVAPATVREQPNGDFPGGSRPLKGKYWFVRRKYRAEAKGAVAKDKAVAKKNLVGKNSRTEET